MISNKRYIALLASIILLAAVSLIKNNSKEIESGTDMTMYITSDIHYLADSLTDNSEGFKEFATPRDGKMLFYINEIMDAFTDEIKKDKPDILIISGDLTTNGEKESHLELADRLNKIEKMGTQVFVVPGNHDIKSIWAKGYKNNALFAVESIDHKDFKDIYNNFGYDHAISTDGDSLSYLAAPSEDVWLLMLDSNKYIEDMGMPTNRGIISSDTLEWIRECNKLAKEKNAQIVTIMHHNLLPHSVRMNDGNTLDNSKEAIETFKELELNLFFSGHIHIQDIKADNEDSPLIYEIASSALSVYPQQYGVLKYSTTQGFDYGTKKVNVDEWASLKGITDADLLNFKEYSKNTFGIRTYNRAIEELNLVGGYSDDEMIEMANLVTDLNLRYFEGTINTIKQDLVKTPLYKQFIDINSEALYDSVYNMIHNGNRDSSTLKIPNTVK